MPTSTGTPVAASAPAPTATVAERARARFSGGGVQIINPELLGTVPCNRSGLGLSGFHVHEVVASIKEDGLSRRRYRDAAVVRVPEAHLDSFRAFNQRMCEGDDLLPPFAAGMRYAVLTKNHFVHAVKLFASASALLHGTKQAIKPNPADKILAQHLSEGIWCEVFREELWDEDPEGLRAIVGEDNMDAATDLAASEIEVLQTLRRLLDESRGEKDASLRHRQVLARAKVLFGTQAYSDADLSNLYNFAVRVPGKLVENLCQVHFAVVPAALLRVRPVDFGTAAKLDPAWPYVKVALVVSLYLGAIASGGGALRRQAGGVAAVAHSLKKDAIEVVASRPKVGETAEAFLRAVLKNYSVDFKKAYAKELLHCRARLFHRAGMMLQHWPASELAAQAALAKIEARYAEELLAASAFTERPPALYAAPALAKTAGTAEAKATSKIAKPQGPKGAVEVLTEDGVFDAAALASAASGPSGSASSAGPAAAGAAAAAQLAYHLAEDGFARVEAVPWGNYGKELWRRFAQQGLLQMHLKHKASASAVEVSVLEASEPIVFQARALQAMPQGSLVLIPYVSAELLDFAEGSKLKRPRALHPHLPFSVPCQAGVPDMGDVARFLAKSPLASGPAIPASAPAPFWAVLEAQAEEDANMESTTFELATSLPTFVLNDGAKKRGKKDHPAAMKVIVPAMANIKPLQRCEVLVFRGSLALEEEEEV